MAIANDSLRMLPPLKFLARVSTNRFKPKRMIVESTYAYNLLLSMPESLAKSVRFCFTDMRPSKTFVCGQ